MRTIKFRGRRIDNGEWVYGYFVGTTDSVAIIIPFEKVNYDVGYIGDSECCYCLPETIGQFTGLYDKNKNEIYEGDIIKTRRYGVVHGKTNSQGSDLFRVVYKDAQFYIENKLRHFYLQDSKCNEIIGDVIDNPELLKGGNDE